MKSMNERIIYKPSDECSPLRQGEILTGVIQYKPIIDEIQDSLELHELSFTPICHPYTIVVTQDCDLDWDYKARTTNSNPTKLLNSVVLCEIETAEKVRGNEGVNRKEWELIVAHRHERYYFFENFPPESELQKEGLPELTADFKRVFSIDSGTLYHQIKIGVVKRRAMLISPYLEHFSGRYHNFHNRIALPFQYESQREG